MDPHRITLVSWVQIQPRFDLFFQDYTKEVGLLAQLLVPKFKMSLDELFCPVYSTPEPCAYLQLDLLHSLPVQVAHKTGEATSRPSKTVEERMESSHCEH